MSYILDALKKSEKERQRGTVPAPLTMQDFSPWIPRRRWVWTYVMILAFLVNTGAFIWWLEPWKAKNTESSVQSTADSQYPVSISGNTSSKQVERTEAYQGTDIADGQRLKKDTANKANQNTNASNIHILTKSRVNDPIQPHEQGFAGSPKGEANNTTREMPIQDKLYNMNELPSSVLQKLPPINISIALYSDEPSTRMARINGKTMQEGQYLADGLRLEEITHGSVVFSYHGYHFRVGLQ